MWFPPQYNHPAPGSMSPPATEPQFLVVNCAHPLRIAHVQLARPPVNALNIEMMAEFIEWLRYLGSVNGVKAVVISSLYPGIFSAGGDFVELHHPTRERFAAFWRAQQELWLLLNTYPKPIVAAINGNCTGAGCAVALSCDYRVMAKQAAGSAASRPFVIGLPESKLGIVAPPWMAANFAHVVGSRRAELLLVEGTLLPCEEALKWGLVDEVVSAEDLCVESAFAQAEKYAKVSCYSLVTTRHFARREYIGLLSGEANLKNDEKAMTDLIFNEKTQEAVDKFVTAIQGRRNNK